MFFGIQVLVHRLGRIIIFCRVEQKIAVRHISISYYYPHPSSHHFLVLFSSFLANMAPHNLAIRAQVIALKVFDSTNY